MDDVLVISVGLCTCCIKKTMLMIYEKPLVVYFEEEGREIQVLDMDLVLTDTAIHITPTKQTKKAVLDGGVHEKCSLPQFEKRNKHCDEQLRQWFLAKLWRATQITEDMQVIKDNAVWAVREAMSFGYTPGHVREILSTLKHVPGARTAISSIRASNSRIIHSDDAILPIPTRTFHSTL